jgi:hypothetical protein
VFAAGVEVDFAWFFEDICYKTAPLVSPDFVRRLMAPRYRTVVDLLHAQWVRTIILDSDGSDPSWNRAASFPASITTCRRMCPTGTSSIS